VAAAIRAALASSNAATAVNSRVIVVIVCEPFRM
jgi:hypothetical protein